MQKTNGTGADDLIIGPEAPNQPEIRALIDALDAMQTELYPAESNHFLDVEALLGENIHFLVARLAGRPVGCGALIVYAGYGEIKRMYVLPVARGRQLGQRLLTALEHTASENGLDTLRLETGTQQPAAISLYRNAGFYDCARFGDYPADPLSVFMEKRIGTG